MQSEKNRMFSVANQKGGVGKTTTAINLGAALAALGKRVLLIDLDPQGNASTGLGVLRETRTQTTYDVLVSGVPLEMAVQPTSVSGLDVLPSTTDLASADMEMMQTARRTTLLKSAIASSKVDYDYILADCPPALNLLTINSLVGSTAVIVPLQAEFFALEGLSQLLLTIRQIRATANPDLRVEGIVMTMYDRRNNLCQQVDSDVRETLGDLVYETRIPRNVRLSEASSHAKPVTEYDPQSRGSVAYMALAFEFLQRNESFEEACDGRIELI